jgi:hypothetical protein
VTTSKWIALAALFFLLYSCLPSYSDRLSLRVTAEVETPDGLKTGSSVISYRFKKKPWWYPAQGNGYYDTFGEAPVVNLGAGRYIFVLLDGGGSSSAGSKLLEYKDGRRLNSDKTVMAQYMPHLVTFEDTKDRSTLRDVDPENLSGVFGAGHRLIRISVVQGNEPPTFGTIEKILPFRHSMKSDDESLLAWPSPEFELQTISWRSFQNGKPR